MPNRVQRTCDKTVVVLMVLLLLMGLVTLFSATYYQKAATGDALAAVTDDDNMNVMVCQLASEIFKVPRVLARVYDPRRGNVFSHFGLHTVCPTNISVDAIYSMLTGRDQVKNVYLDSATVSFDADEPDAKEIGLTLGELVLRNNAKQGLFGLLHADGNLTLAHPNSNEEVGPDDRLLYAKVID